ncbi:MAG TPA: DUF4336 domain-containing protein [Steroidobacteraceae bacterium]|nr:DUF4336 domain-containing protein [Steroidobacteraceae bacterium]
MAIEPLVPERIWHVRHAIRFAGLPIHTRMTVIRLTQDRLFVHSPVPLDDPGHAVLAASGQVAFIVAPNRFHHLFVRAWRDRYPDALLCAAPGLPAKRPGIRFDRVLGDAAEPEWDGDLDQHLCAGMPALNEVVFFDRTSRTLLVTDLCQHITAQQPRAVRWVARLLGVDRGLAMSRTLRFMLRDRAAFRATRDRILAWDFDRVILAHDTVVEVDGRRAFREAFEFVD